MAFNDKNGKHTLQYVQTGRAKRYVGSTIPTQLYKKHVRKPGAVIPETFYYTEVQAKQKGLPKTAYADYKERTVHICTDHSVRFVHGAAVHEHYHLMRDLSYQQLGVGGLTEEDAIRRFSLNIVIDGSNEQFGYLTNQYAKVKLRALRWEILDDYLKLRALKNFLAGGKEWRGSSSPYHNAMYLTLAAHTVLMVEVKKRGKTTNLELMYQHRLDPADLWREIESVLGHPPDINIRDRWTEFFGLTMECWTTDNQWLQLEWIERMLQIYSIGQDDAPTQSPFDVGGHVNREQQTEAPPAGQSKPSQGSSSGSSSQPQQGDPQQGQAGESGGEEGQASDSGESQSGGSGGGKSGQSKPQSSDDKGDGGGGGKDSSGKQTNDKSKGKSSGGSQKDDQSSDPSTDDKSDTTGGSGGKDDKSADDGKNKDGEGSPAGDPKHNSADKSNSGDTPGDKPDESKDGQGGGGASDKKDKPEGGKGDGKKDSQPDQGEKQSDGAQDNAQDGQSGSQRRPDPSNVLNRPKQAPSKIELPTDGIGKGKDSQDEGMMDAIQSDVDGNFDRIDAEMDKLNQPATSFCPGAPTCGGSDTAEPSDGSLIVIATATPSQELADQLKLANEPEVSEDSRRGKVNVKKYIAAPDSPDIFDEWTETELSFGPQSYIMAMLDTSGSMRSSAKWSAVQVAAMTIHHACSMAEVPYSIVTSRDMTLLAGRGYKTINSRAYYDRSGIPPLLDALEEVILDEERGTALIAGSQAYSSGGDNYTNTLPYALNLIAQRHEEARVLLMITDGAPHNIPMLRRQIDAAEDTGTVVLGVGLNLDASHQQGMLGMFSIPERVVFATSDDFVGPLAMALNAAIIVSMANAGVR